jgi:hypothetical protein
LDTITRPRGFCSSIDYRLHFGIDNAENIDSIKILWPHNKMQVLRNVEANQVLTLGKPGGNMKHSDKEQRVERRHLYLVMLRANTT